MDTGMIFAIIFAILFIGFLLAYGVNSIQDLFCTTEQANTFRAVKDLKTVAEGLYTKAEGSSDIFRLTMPAASKICFMDPDHWGANTNHYDTDRNWDPQDNPSIYYSLDNDFAEHYGSNVWIFFCGNNQGFKIKNLKPCESSQPFVDLTIPGQENWGNFCTKSGTELFLINRGDHVEVQLNEHPECIGLDQPTCIDRTSCEWSTDHCIDRTANDCIR